MNTIYKIALSFINGLGSVNLKKAIAYTGGLEAFFRERTKNLIKIPGVGESLVQRINREDALIQAEKELKFIEKNKIHISFYMDDSYPQKLLHCPDAPCTLYYKGDFDFNLHRNLSIVGTRNASDYGKEQCNKLIKNLSEKKEKTTIISGLAYGIDVCAHKAALQHDLPTVAVVGHGLNRVYPFQHKNTAEEILKNKGALLTEFTTSCKFAPKNFVRRNRIIAGISDATVVIESAKKGGSLITAEIANSYNRDVFAFPGRTYDKYSAGCNHLIKTNQAHLIETVSDLEYILGWEKQKSQVKEVQAKLFADFTADEEKLITAFKNEHKMPIDLICAKTSFPMSKVSALLLKLEFNGFINSHPGKTYSINL